MKPAALVFALLTALPACIAQQPSSAVPKDPFRLPAGEVQLSALVDQCALYLGTNILWNPQELSQASTPNPKLQHPVETDREGCEELLTSMLIRSGLALVSLDEKGSLMEVISLNGPRAREFWARAQERSVEAVLARPNLKLPVTVMMPLEHINATIATNALRPFFASTGSNAGGSLTIGNVGNNSALLISGMQDQVVQAIRLLRKCDIPGGTDIPGMPVVVDGERVQRLEQRVKALEDQIAKTKPSEPKVGEAKPASGDTKPK